MSKADKVPNSEKNEDIDRFIRMAYNKSKHKKSTRAIQGKKIILQDKTRQNIECEFGYFEDVLKNCLGLIWSSLVYAEFGVAVQILISIEKTPFWGHIRWPFESATDNDTNRWEWLFGHLTYMFLTAYRKY